jgi:pilus assembly protein Flp/PilA
MASAQLVTNPAVGVEEELMNRVIMRFAKDESGATAIEYGLIAAGISVAIIAVVNGLGSQLKTTFSTVSSQLATACNWRILNSKWRRRAIRSAECRREAH